jgi:hypothetical protein
MAIPLTSICPHCSKVNTHQSAADGNDVMPTAGDATICFNCFGAAIWTSLGGLRKPTDLEHAEIEALPEIQKMRVWRLHHG